MSQLIVGFCGFAGSGKDTAADFIKAELEKENIIVYKDSFANKLKDVISILMSWDRNLLQGSTIESRNWREQPDEFWSNVVGYPITPRQIMQKIGTDLLRNQFSKSIWIASLFAKYQNKHENSVILITDCRFPNEIDAVEQKNGLIVQISRESDPKDYTNLHESEYAWKNYAKQPINIYNNGCSLDEYHQELIQIIDKIKEKLHEN